MLDEKYLPKRGTVDVSGGLSAVAQGLMAMGGEQVPYYTNYLEAQTKRRAMEIEAQRFAQEKLLQQQQLMVDRAKLRATVGENRSQAGLRGAQMQSALADAESKRALAVYYKSNSGSVSPTIDPITGQPSGMVLAGIGPRGPRFENLDVIAQKKQLDIASRKYSAQDAKSISQAESLVGKISRLKDMVGTNAEGLSYIPFGGGTEKGQMFQSLKKDISNTLLYLRSGAQINEQEYKRLSSQLPQLFRRASVDKDQLDRFTNEFNGVLTRIKGGSPSEKKLSGGSDLSKMSDNELRKLAGA